MSDDQSTGEEQAHPMRMTTGFMLNLITAQLEERNESFFLGNPDDSIETRAAGLRELAISLIIALSQSEQGAALDRYCDEFLVVVMTPEEWNQAASALGPEGVATSPEED